MCSAAVPACNLCKLASMAMLPCCWMMIQSNLRRDSKIRTNFQPSSASARHSEQSTPGAATDLHSSVSPTRSILNRKDGQSVRAPVNLSVFRSVYESVSRSGSSSVRPSIFCRVCRSLILRIKRLLKSGNTSASVHLLIGLSI